MDIAFNPATIRLSRRQLTVGGVVEGSLPDKMKSAQATKSNKVLRHRSTTALVAVANRLAQDRMSYTMIESCTAWNSGWFIKQSMF
jgi:hypothetical protein